MWIAATAVALLLIASAVLTTSHDAVQQIAKSHVRTLEDEGFDGADELAALREEQSARRVTVRLVKMLLDLTAVAIIARTGVLTWGFADPVVSTGIGVLSVVLLTNVLPNVVAARRPVRIALTSAPAMLRLVRAAQPLTAPLARLQDGVGAEEARTPEHRELREIQEIGEEEGVLEEAENRLVERAFRLDELTVRDVMIPRVDIFAWKEELTLEELVEELADVPYSRVPVYRDSVDDVRGIVYVREMYERYAKGDRKVRLAALAREPFFVPPSLSLTQLLEDFQARRIHLGIVADEFGGVDGLVTLEDVLEELVGEIRDETDVEEEGIARISEEVLECSAGVDLRDLDDALDVSLPKAEHRSLNGFILDELGYVPRVGETFEAAGVRFDILEATDTQVLRARVTRLHPVREERD